MDEQPDITPNEPIKDEAAPSEKPIENGSRRKSDSNLRQRLEDGKSIAEIVGVVIAIIALFYLGRQVGMQRDDIQLQRQSIQQLGTASAEQNALLLKQIEEQATQSAEQIQSQATLSSSENTLIQEQIQQQRQINLDNRRAQLLKVMYGRRDCEAENIDDCPMVESARIRAEAVLVFIEIEKERGNVPLNLADVNLSRTYLSNADLRKAHLEGADLSFSNMPGTNLAHAILFRTNLRSTYLHNANMLNANLTEANLSGADLSEAILLFANLNGADLTAVNLNGAGLLGADLTEANLNGADLTAANLNGANLTEANLTGADLTNAYLGGANFSSAELTGAILAGENFDLDGAVYNSKTIWPEGFNPEAHNLVLDDK